MQSGAHNAMKIQPFFPRLVRCFLSYCWLVCRWTLRSFVFVFCWLSWSVCFCFSLLLRRVLVVELVMFRCVASLIFLVLDSCLVSALMSSWLLCSIAGKRTRNASTTKPSKLKDHEQKIKTLNEKQTNHQRIINTRSTKKQRKHSTNTQTEHGKNKRMESTRYST